MGLGVWLGETEGAYLWGWECGWGRLKEHNYGAGGVVGETDGA